MGDTVTVYGLNNTVINTYSATVNFQTNSSGSVNGTGHTVGTNGTGIAVNATGDTVNTANSAAFAFSGGGNNITLSSGASVNVAGTNGSADTVNAAWDTVSVSSSTQVTVGGGVHDTINGNGSSATVIVTGDSPKAGSEAKTSGCDRDVGHQPDRRHRRFCQRVIVAKG